LKIVFSDTHWAAEIISIDRRQSSSTAAATEVTEVRSPNSFFRIEKARVSGGFASLTFLCGGVDRRFLQGLIAIASLNSLYNFPCSLYRPWQQSPLRPSC
jgi:hypothetical protein